MAPIIVTVLAAGGDRQAPVAGLDSHIVRFNGRFTLPVSTEAIIMPIDPTFTDATAKALIPRFPGKLTIPSPVGVATSAITSDTGLMDLEYRKVFTPGITVAGRVLVQSKLSCISVGANGALDVKANRKVCATPSAISIGVFGVPVKALVAGFVVW